MFNIKDNPDVWRSRGRHSLAILVTMGWLSCTAVTSASAQDALFIDPNGSVGLGTNVPNAALEILRPDGTAQLLIDNSSAPDAALREMFVLANNGGPFFIFRNQDLDRSYSFAMQGDRFIISQQQSAGVQFELFANGNLRLGGALINDSSRELKTAIEEISPESVLAKVAKLPISTWQYKDDAKTVRHMGPMSEDFADAFELGPSRTGISTIDTSGVALAAIKGLKRTTDSELSELRKRNEELTNKVESLSKIVRKLQAHTPIDGRPTPVSRDSY